MTELGNKLQEFRMLTPMEKKQKLMNIFEYSRNKIDFSESAMNYLKYNDAPDELVMWNLYELIVQAVMFSKERNQTDFEQKMGENTWTIKEKACKAQEIDSQEADNLLGLIDLI